jgi:hypothetical protein
LDDWIDGDPLGDRLPNGRPQPTQRLMQEWDEKIFYLLESRCE